MGLDVYLYRCDDWPKTLKDEALYDKRSEAIWEKIKNGRDFNALSESERKDAAAQTEALAAKMGMGKYGYSAAREKIERDSALYPDHICKIGYLRSSYNEGGFDRVVSNALGVDGFYYIFDRKSDDDYLFAPDWRLARKRATEVAEKLAKESLRVSVISPNVFGSVALPADEMEALAIARKELVREQKGAFAACAYSNGAGHFFPGEMLKIRALIPGTTSTLRAAHPCVYAVYEADITHYVNSAKIAAEMCAYVLAHPKPDTFRLAWSS